MFFCAIKNVNKSRSRDKHATESIESFTLQQKIVNVIQSGSGYYVFFNWSSFVCRFFRSFFSRRVIAVVVTIHDKHTLFRDTLIDLWFFHSTFCYQLNGIFRNWVNQIMWSDLLSFFFLPHTMQTSHLARDSKYVYARPTFLSIFFIYFQNILIPNFPS